MTQLSTEEGAPVPRPLKLPRPPERGSASARCGAARREMMKSRLLIAVSGSVLALTACNKNNEATTTNAADANIAMDNGAAADMTAAPSPTSAQGFANTAAASDRFEIESSKLAAGQASSA